MAAAGGMAEAASTAAEAASTVVAAASMAVEAASMAVEAASMAVEANMQAAAMVVTAAAMVAVTAVGMVVITVDMVVMVGTTVATATEAPPSVLACSAVQSLVRSIRITIPATGPGPLMSAPRRTEVQILRNPAPASLNRTIRRVERTSATTAFGILAHESA
jgi:hypothetical protein